MALRPVRPPLPRFTCYDLRRTHATRTFEEIKKRGLDYSREVSEPSHRLEHKDVATTEQAYIHLCADFTTRATRVSMAAAFPEGPDIKFPDDDDDNNDPPYDWSNNIDAQIQQEPPEASEVSGGSSFWCWLAIFGSLKSLTHDEITHRLLVDGLWNGCG